MQIGTHFITLEQYLSYGDQPVEVVDGEVILMTAAHTRRQPNIVTNLFRKMDSFVYRKKLDKVFTEASTVLDGDRRSNRVSGARTPNLSFISRERIDAHNAKHPADDEPWWLAPDLAVEVISPTDRYDEISQKVGDYLRFGVKLVWVIDAAAKVVRVHTPAQPLGQSRQGSDQLTAEGVIDGWSMQVSELFVED